jgi:hypothetical protein
MQRQHADFTTADGDSCTESARRCLSFPVFSALMLAPRAASAFVCIRCELKLARTALSSPSLPSLSRRPSRANFSALSLRRDAFDDAAAQRLDNTPPPRPKASEHPLGKIRKRKGKAALRESTAQLAGVKTLGKDSEILVLEEIGSAAKPNEPPEPEALVSLEQKDEDAQRAGGILASLEAEGVELGEEESNQQLDNLRPSTHSTTSPDEPHYITQADFLKLQKALIEGFSVKQLSRYFSVRKGIHQGAVTTEIINNLSIPGTAKGAVARSEWSPGTSPLSRRLPGSLGLRGPKRKPVSKRALVDQLLRSVWNLVLLEEIEAPGEIEMTLKLWQLVLLTTGGLSGAFSSEQLGTDFVQRRPRWIASETSARPRLKCIGLIPSYESPPTRAPPNTPPTMSSLCCKVPNCKSCP